jgi:hypothetical protein
MKENCEGNCFYWSSEGCVLGLDIPSFWPVEMCKGFDIDDCK